jgi:PTH1 family peptidyl-tRNA hydrolase
MTSSIKAVIGLGNPGRQYYHHRHTIGFRVVDALCARHGGSWQTRDIMDVAEVIINGQKVILIKPLTFMNTSGKVIPFLHKKGIGIEQILVVHDELEIPFGALKIRVGGSARGHNGLRSIIGAASEQFARLRFGIGRPERKEDVGDYVLRNFSENEHELERLIDEAADMIEAAIV